ncbi:MAG TPA: divergent polysaccharide deacetylase family protein [Stellaceae bacterium]|nr:divergent polysaccharide deacetylase family protein [Stellaceae bacterium]
MSDTAPGPRRRPASRRLLWIIGAVVAAGLGAVLAVIMLGPGGPAVRGDRVEVVLPPLAAAPSTAPDPDLVEQSPDGPLPIIGRDGREPWRVYARPFDATDHRPLVAVVISGLGLDAALTRDAVARLPASVTLGFSPYTRDLAAEIAAARKAGHEVLIGLPLEPADFPRQDPGPETLLTTLDPSQNLLRLKWVMSRGTNYVGLVGIMGQRFSTVRTSLEPVLEAMKQRGVMYVDNHAAGASVAGEIGRDLGMAWAVADRRLDGETDAAAIDQSLASLETIAAQQGVALGVGAAYPLTVERVIAWAPTLASKGIVLAPASAIAGRQQVPASPTP